MKKAKRKVIPELSWVARPYYLPPGHKRWKAEEATVLRFCAPACGFDCTMEAFKKVERLASGLCARLGAGWAPHLWENMGWFYEAISPCGNIKVRKDRGARTYTADLGGRGRWSGTGSTPRRAVRMALDLARSEAKGIQLLVKEAEAA